MFKRVTADLLFTNEDEAEDFYNDCEKALMKATTINPGNLNEERSRILIQECHHDEDPPEPCLIIDQAETLTPHL